MGSLFLLVTFKMSKIETFSGSRNWKLETVKEALRRMRVRQERFAIHHGTKSSRNASKSSSVVKAMAASVVDFVTEGMKEDSETPLCHLDTLSSSIQITTSPAVVSIAMGQQQIRAEASLLSIKIQIDSLLLQATALTRSL